MYIYSMYRTVLLINTCRNTHDFVRTTLRRYRFLVYEVGIHLLYVVVHLRARTLCVRGKKNQWDRKLMCGVVVAGDWTLALMILSHPDRSYFARSLVSSVHVEGERKIWCSFIKIIVYWHVWYLYLFSWFYARSVMLFIVGLFMLIFAIFLCFFFTISNRFYFLSSDSGKNSHCPNTVVAILCRIYIFFFPFVCCARKV